MPQKLKLVKGGARRATLVYGMRLFGPEKCKRWKTPPRGLPTAPLRV